MTRHDDEITPREFADILGIHYDTVCRWCLRAVSEPTARLYGFVRQTVTGRYYIDRAAIDEIQDQE